MEETVFYILGIGLVVAAFLVSAIGLRWENFPPSRGALVAGTVAFVALVGATATFAWMNAEEEQSEHAAEHAAERAAAAEEEAAEIAAEEGEAGPAGEGDVAETTPTETAAADGAQVFESAGCGGCHTLAAAGSTATTGPVLDGALKGKSPKYIETAIVDPNADIAKGFPPDVMPQTYGEDLTPEELQALVDYLVESTGGKS